MGVPIVRDTNVICARISEYIAKEYGKNYDDNLKSNYFKMIISHEILEIGMTYYVPAVSLKVFGVFSSDLEIFKDLLSEWMVYNVLRYKDRMRERIEEEMEKKFGREILEKYLGMELYFRDENFSLKELEGEWGKDSSIGALIESLKRSAILLKLGDENIFKEFLNKYSNWNLRDEFDDVNRIYYMLLIELLRENLY